LLAEIAFDRERDRLWFVGDLVNRGPDSLACLRFVKALGDRAIAVLGNHDLHLVCLALGLQKRGRRDTLDDVLAAPDRDGLIDWLRTRPLMHVEAGVAMVHAGLLPEWTIEKAAALAAEVQARLRGRDHRELLGAMYGDEPRAWSETLEGNARARVVINAMTRLRVCTRAGEMALDFKGEPDDAPGDRIPWFDMPGRASRTHAIACGHWSALGLLVRDDLLSLDSGCVWGRALTAVRLEDRATFSVPCPPGAGPEG
jgi:bis(5'-nucleosyl)-tetraphosphatase (symmetrical)